MEMTAVEDPGWQEITPKYKHVFRQEGIPASQPRRKGAASCFGRPKEQTDSDTQAPGLARSAGDSGLAGSIRLPGIRITSAEQPFVTGVTREALEPRGRASELLPHVPTGHQRLVAVNIRPRTHPCWSTRLS